MKIVASFNDLLEFMTNVKRPPHSLNLMGDDNSSRDTIGLKKEDYYAF
jgi:hypothetical protein